MGELNAGPAVASGGGGPSWWLVAAGAGLLALGLVLLRRRGERRGPTRLTAGVCGLVVGYHLLAWGLPAGWLALRIPTGRWWLLAGGVAVALAGSAAADALERRRPAAMASEGR